MHLLSGHHAAELLDGELVVGHDKQDGGGNGNSDEDQAVLENKGHYKPRTLMLTLKNLLANR